MAEKGASLSPSTWVQGGGVADGEYTITKVRACTFDYQGQTAAGPSLEVTYTDSSGDTTQNYSAGKLEHLVPAKDGHRFVHPRGEEAHLAKGSNCSMFLQSIFDAGFPVPDGDDVTVFEGTKVLIVNKPQPKRGVKEEKEGKVIALVSKIIALPKGKGKSAAAAAVPAQSKPVPVAESTATPASNGAGNSLDEEARTAVLEALAVAPDNTLTRVKLSTNVMLALAKAKSPHMVAIKKLTDDATWLVAQAAEGGWSTEDGEAVKLG